MRWSGEALWRRQPSTFCRRTRAVTMVSPVEPRVHKQTKPLSGWTLGGRRARRETLRWARPGTRRENGIRRRGHRRAGDGGRAGEAVVRCRVRRKKSASASRERERSSREAGLARASSARRAHSLSRRVWRGCGPLFSIQRRGRSEAQIQDSACAGRFRLTVESCGREPHRRGNKARRPAKGGGRAAEMGNRQRPVDNYR